MTCSTHAMGPAGAYLLLALGIVLGSASVVAVLMWRKVVAERARTRYFADVATLARRGGR